MSKVKSQKSKVKTTIQKSKFLILTFSFAFCVFTFTFSFAQDQARVNTLTKKIIDAGDANELYGLFEELTDTYLQENKYSEFVQLLQSLSAQEASLDAPVNYYIALGRYYQLKYLEQAQAWDEYFNQGNAYRDQITQSLDKAIQATGSGDVLHIYARLLLWKFHKDQETALADSALSELTSDTLTYAKEAVNLIPIEDVANQLSSYGQAAQAREIYKVYVDKIAGSDISNEDLANIALGFYQEGNLGLSESIYDIYIDRITPSTPKEELIPVLINIAKAFSYRVYLPYDGYYAEKIFKMIEDAAGLPGFSMDLIYIRAYNLEKIKEHEKAKEVYITLIERYPGGVYADEVSMKIGFLYAYVSRDLENAKIYFGKSVGKEQVNPYIISNLYQLGLLNQWEENIELAREYYNKIIEESKKVTAEDKFADTLALVEERLKEMDEPKPMEYGLKVFLDASLKPEDAAFDMKRVELKSSAEKVSRGQEVDLNVIPYIGESGCMQVELQYLWSGHLGGANPSSEQPALAVSYNNTGTKEVNLVVVSSTGVIDRSFNLIDVN